MPKAQRLIITTPGQLRNQSAKRDPKRDPIKAAIEKIKEEHKDRLTPELWLRELLSVEGIDSVAILKQLPDMRWARRGMWVRGSQMFSAEAFSESSPGDGVEHFLASAYGDGTFQLQAIGQHAQRGGFTFTVIHGKESPVGEPNVGNVDSVLAMVAQREANIAGVRQLRSLNDEPKENGDVGMKASEFKEMAEGMAALMRASGGANGTEALLAEIRAMREEMKGQAAQPTTNGIAALVGPVAELLSKNPNGAWPFLRLFLNRVAPEPTIPNEPPPKSLIETAQELLTGLGPMIAKFVETPIGQAVIAKMMATAVPNGAPVTDRVIEVPPQRVELPPERVRGPYDDILDAIVEQLRRAPDDRDFLSLANFLDGVTLNPATDERMLDRVRQIATTSDELARVTLRQLDARLADQVWDGARAFLDYLREHPREDEPE